MTDIEPEKERRKWGEKKNKEDRREGKVRACVREEDKEDKEE